MQTVLQNSIFLTAEWRYLVMINYEVDRGLLQPLVPLGTELDFFDDRAFLSVVGFHFKNTRIFGIPIPLHSNFEEVNLRFYVRRRTDSGWRRGVVFIREIVPRHAIAFVARTFYGEPYSAFPMRHSIDISNSKVHVEYAWKRKGRWESVRAVAKGASQSIQNGSEEEFITEHYWGYTARKNATSEYEVEHPKWNIWQTAEATFDVDVASLYGERFVESLSAAPSSAFIADGSPIIVRGNSTLLKGGGAD